MTKQKRSPRRRLSPSPSVVLTKGDWLDVMDQEGVWNVARVLSVPSPEEVEIMYDGWPEEYDEVVRVDSDRVAPLHTFTWAAKCWVKYLNWPMWPSLITIRTPGTQEGIRNLATENRLYVDFLDSPDFEKRDRCWQKKKQVVAFDENYDKNRVMTNGAQFEQALVYVLRSNATIKMPAFAKGTLPLQYKNTTTESVERMREKMGRELWVQNFAKNASRHMQTHVYGITGDDSAEDPASDESTHVRKLAVRKPKSSTPKEGQRQNSPKKKRSSSKKQQHESLAEVEVPYELEVSDSSDDHGDRSESEVIEAVSQTMTVTKRKVLPVKAAARRSVPPVTAAARRSVPPVKATARRSVPPVTKYLILTASPKRRAERSSSLLPGIDLEDEEKGVLKEVEEEVELQEPVTKFPISERKTKRTGREEVNIDDVASPKTSRRSNSSKKTLTDVEQQIEMTKEALRGFNAEKKELIKDDAGKERRKRGKPSSPSSQDVISSRRHKIQSRLEHPDVSGLLLLSRSDGRRQGRIIETPLDVSSTANSFLAVEEDPDGQETTEELAIDVQSEPKEVKRRRKEEAKLVTERESSVKGNQLPQDEDWVEEKSEEIRRPFCMMQSSVKGTEVADDEKAKTRVSKKTVIGVPRKFDEEASRVYVSSADSMLRIAPPPPLSGINASTSSVSLAAPSTAVFDSSEGFSMGTWFKRTLIAKYRRTET